MDCQTFLPRLACTKNTVIKGVTSTHNHDRTGTHTGTLIPPLTGKFMKVAPTGKKIALAEEILEYTIRDGQIVLQKAQPSPNTGWAGIFKQLGIDVS